MYFRYVPHRMQTLHVILSALSTKRLRRIRLVQKKRSAGGANVLYLLIFFMECLQHSVKRQHLPDKADLPLYALAQRLSAPGLQRNGRNAQLLTDCPVDASGGR